MITAKEARKKAQERSNALETENVEQEKKLAEEKINEAVEKGKSDCWLGGWISHATEKWLRSLGYNVKRLDNDSKVTW